MSFKLDPQAVPDLPQPRPGVRDLRLLAAGRGRAPALRQGRPRRAALERPPRGLPHRDPRPGQGADGEERRHRADRRQGRLRRQAPARPGRRPRGAGWPRASPATRRSSAACSTSPTTSWRSATATRAVAGRRAAARGPARRRRHLPGGRGRQGHGDVLRHRQRRRERLRLLARGRVRLRAARSATTTRRWASPRKGAWESVKRHFRELGRDTQTEDVHRRRRRRHERRRVRQRDAAVASTSGWSRRSTTGTSSSTPTPTPRRLVRRAQPAVRAAALVVGRLRHVADLRRRRGLPARGQVGPDQRRRSRPGSGWRPSTDGDDPGRADHARSCGARSTCCGTAGIGTYVKASTESQRRGRRQGQRRDPGRRRATCACRVVGEGGNLGLTQLGRVEAALHGVRVNTDAIDNSAGRRLLRPRGQHQDPARPRRGRRRPDRASSATRCWPR